MQKRLHTIWLVVSLLLLHSTVSVAYTAELKIEKTLTQTDGLVSNNVLAIFEDSRGNMWFGTTKGLTRYDGESFQTFTTDDGLSRNTIGIILEDRNGMLWFGDGVLSSFLERGKTQDMSWMITPLSEIAKEMDEEISEGRTRNIPLKGVTRYDGHTFRVFTTADGLPRDTVKDIFKDKTGTLWFATSSGVSQYNGKDFNTITLNGPTGMDVLPDWWDQVRAITPIVALMESNQERHHLTRMQLSRSPACFRIQQETFGSAALPALPTTTFKHLFFDTLMSISPISKRWESRQREM